MSNVKIHIRYLGVIFVLLVLLVILLNRPTKVVETVKTQSDTITIIKQDTIRVTQFREVTKKVTDTLLLALNDTVYIPFPKEIKVYKDSLFTAQVSGIQPTLDWIDVYPQTEYRTITNTIEKEILIKRWDWYLGAGLSRLNGELIPSINMAVKTPHKWLFGLNLGLYDNKPVYGATIQYKLTN